MDIDGKASPEKPDDRKKRERWVKTRKASGLLAATSLAAIFELAGGAVRTEWPIRAAAFLFAVALPTNLFIYLKLEGAPTDESMRSWTDDRIFVVLTLVGYLAPWFGVIAVFSYFSTEAGVALLIVPVGLFYFSCVKARAGRKSPSPHDTVGDQDE